MGLSDVWKREQDNGLPRDEVVQTGDGRNEPLAVGKLVGEQFELEKVLHEGGMGILYLARHRKSGRQVVVKMIKTDGMIEDADRQLFNRFRREAKGMAQFSHPNIVRILGCDFSDIKQPYIVMEYIDGVTLFRFLKRQTEGVGLKLFMHMMAQLCSAFDAIHKKNIVHRDLKPDNVMLIRGSNYKLKVLDLGLIIFERAMSTTAVMRLTRQGQVVGTPAYMSPEQCMGGTITHQSDIYSLGLLGYELLTGKPVCAGKNPKDIFMQQIREMPRAPHLVREGIPRSISDGLMKALAKEPEQRPVSCKAFWQLLHFGYQSAD